MRLLFSKRYDPTIDLNTKINAPLLTPLCRMLAKIILHNVLPQRGHFDEVKGDAILLLYALMKKIKVNFAHAFVCNLVEGKSIMGYEVILIKFFKKVKINVKSKVPGEYKGDSDVVTLKRMKLLVIHQSEEPMIMGETAEEQLQRDEAEYPNSVLVQKKRRMDTAARRFSKEE